MSIDTLQQFESMKEIGAIVANCLEFLKARVRVGMSTKELDVMAAKFLDEHGAVSAPKSCYNFPGYVCLSHERAAAHGIPNGTILEAGDLLNIDVSASKNGFFADNGESVVIGHDAHKEHLCHAVKLALKRAINKIRAGAPLSVIGLEVEKIARAKNLSIIENLCGHGVGHSLHEEPQYIPSFYDKKDKRRLGLNQVIAIEPFLSDGATWIEEAQDGWTLYHPKFYCVQKEHTLMVTKQKPHIFTLPTKTFS